MLGSIPQVGIGSKAAAAGFAPTDIAGCKLWLRGDLGVTQSGGAVSAWADQSGQGNHVTQATATRKPTFVAASGINSKPGLTFDMSVGPGSRLDNTASNLWAAGSARTVVVVARITATTTLNAFLSSRRSAPGHVFMLSSEGTGYVASDGATFADAITPAPAVANINWIIEYTAPSNGGSPGSGLVVKLNGVTQTLTTTSTGGETGGVDGFCIGDRLDGGAGLGVSYTMVEQVAYDNVVSAAGGLALRQYMADAYAIAI